MKTTKKRLLSFLLATVMAFAMAVPAFADTDEEPTINSSRTFYSWEELQNDRSVTIEPESVMPLSGEPYSTTLNLDWQSSTVGAVRSYSGNTLYCTFNDWDCSYNEGVYGRLTSQVGTKGILGFSSISTKRTQLSQSIHPTFTVTFPNVGNGSRAFAFSMYRGDFMCNDVILGSY